MAVQQVLYLIFNEGYTASAGARLHRVELSAEAIRLARLLHSQLPQDGEVAGLLALMLLTDARRPARTAADGRLIPLAEQDRGLWDAAAIAEGVALITATLARAPIGPYQLQAAIAAVHDEAARPEDTDWPQILQLYGMLRALAPGPMVMLNRIVALAMVDGPHPALAELAAAAPELGDHHRVSAVRAHLLEMAGDLAAAREEYQRAARLTLSVPEQRYLEGRAGRDPSPAGEDGRMADCNLCPPGARDIPDDEMAEHLRTAHPEVDQDGTRRSDASTIVPGTDLGPGPEAFTE
jgi:predicted RNA polymerase sigma factor